MSTAPPQLPLDGDSRPPAVAEPQINITVPSTQLHHLATLAAGCLLIDDARLYGLIDGDPGIDRARCHHLIRQAALQGMVVDEDEAAAAALDVMAELGALRR